VVVAYGRVIVAGWVEDVSAGAFVEVVIALSAVPERIPTLPAVEMVLALSFRHGSAVAPEGVRTRRAVEMVDTAVVVEVNK
jgi:hypothetical protein